MLQKSRPLTDDVLAKMTRTRYGTAPLTFGRRMTSCISNVFM